MTGGPMGSVPIAAMGVTLSGGFVAAVHERLPESIRLALWVLREATRCPEPAAAAVIVEHLVDRAIRLAAQECGQELTDLRVEQMRGCVVDAVLGDRRQCCLVGLAEVPEPRPAAAGVPPPVAAAS